MHDDPKENDWKTFRKMVPGLRERYLATRNEELILILGDPQRSPTERFWDLEKRSKEIAKILRECLDGHTRSKMRSFMMLMITHGMLSQDDISEFSEELRERLAWFLE